MFNALRLFRGGDNGVLEDPDPDPLAGELDRVEDRLLPRGRKKLMKLLVELAGLSAGRCSSPMAPVFEYGFNGDETLTFGGETTSAGNDWREDRPGIIDESDDLGEWVGVFSGFADILGNQCAERR